MCVVEYVFVLVLYCCGPREWWYTFTEYFKDLQEYVRVGSEFSPMNWSTSLRIAPKKQLVFVCPTFQSGNWRTPALQQTRQHMTMLPDSK